MRTFLWLCCLGFTILDPRPSNAQPVPALTLSGFLNQVLAQHPLIRAADQQVAAAQALVTQARALPSPELSYEYSKLNNFGSVSELVEFPGKRRLRTEIAQVGIRQARENLAKTRGTLAFEARQAFFRRLLADQQVSVARNTLSTVREVADAAQKRFEAGDVAEVEVIKAKVEVARAEQDLRTALGRQRVASLSVNLLMGKPPEAPLTLQGDLAAKVVMPALDDLLRQAYREQPDIVIAREESEKQQKSLLLARRQKFPDITLGALYGVEDSELTPGATISVALPSLRRSRGLVEEATGHRLAALAQEEGQKYQVAEAVASAYEQWLAASAQVDVYRAGLLNESETVLKAARESYQEGQSGILDVLDAERTDLLVQQQYQQALFDLQVAAANVILARGGVE
ncbi:MAG TPA: TolC family protein [Bryobacteraceae bacterium]|nr:TolC family protein [Bryobacteraceae bacterium]